MTDNCTRSTCAAGKGSSSTPPYTFACGLTKIRFAPYCRRNRPPPSNIPRTLSARNPGHNRIPTWDITYYTLSMSIATWVLMLGTRLHGFLLRLLLHRRMGGSPGQLPRRLLFRSRDPNLSTAGKCRRLRNVHNYEENTSSHHNDSRASHLQGSGGKPRSGRN